MTWVDTARAIADRVIQTREEAGLSKVEFASIIGVSKQAYTPYEQYSTEYSLEQLFIISRTFGKPLPWLLGLPSELAPDEEQLLHLYRSLPHDDMRKMVISSMKAEFNLASGAGRARPRRSKREPSE